MSLEAWQKEERDILACSYDRSVVAMYNAIGAKMIEGRHTVFQGT